LPKLIVTTIDIRKIMKKYILTTLIAVVLTTGCNTTRVAPDSQTGALRGAAAGGIIGGILGKNVGMFFSRPVASQTAKGLIGGAVGGAILGGLLGAANNQSQVPPASVEEN
jgi:uncharacterized membrane protein